MGIKLNNMKKIILTRSITIVSISGLIVTVTMLLMQNKRLKQENTRLCQIEREVDLLRDSISNITNSYLLVDNINPLVVSETDNTTGITVKRVYLVIRNCNIKSVGLMLGSLDSTSFLLTDTSYSKTITDSSMFNCFIVDSMSVEDKIEGYVSLYFPKTGYYKFAFSEKLNRWW